MLKEKPRCIGGEDGRATRTVTELKVTSSREESMEWMAVHRLGRGRKERERLIYVPLLYNESERAV